MNTKFINLKFKLATLLRKIKFYTTKHKIDYTTYKKVEIDKYTGLSVYYPKDLKPHPIEQDILVWCVENWPEYSDAISQQITSIKIISRYFSDGGGIYSKIKVNKKAPPVFIAPPYGGGFAGPSIKSAQLECGACSMIDLDEHGFIDGIEIQAHCSDYPKYFNIEDYSLEEQNINVIYDNE